MGVMLEVLKGVRLIVQNSHHRDYPEDDWRIKVIEDTMQEASDNFWKHHYAESEINVDNFYFEKVVYIIYKGKRVVLESEDIPQSESDDVFFESEFYEDAEKRRKDLVTKRREDKLDQIEKDKESQDRVTYEKLKERFG